MVGKPNLLDLSIFKKVLNKKDDTEIELDLSYEETITMKTYSTSTTKDEIIETFDEETTNQTTEETTETTETTEETTEETIEETTEETIEETTKETTEETIEETYEITDKTIYDSEEEKKETIEEEESHELYMKKLSKIWS